MSYILKKKNKKGFTIVELVIVIAVIAVLASVLIPTFSSVVAKANESADVQAARQMNVALAAGSIPDVPQNAEEMIAILAEAGFNAEDCLVPITTTYKFYWTGPKYNTIVLVQVPKAIREYEEQEQAAAAPAALMAINEEPQAQAEDDVAIKVICPTEDANLVTLMEAKLNALLGYINAGGALGNFDWGDLPLFNLENGKEILQDILDGKPGSGDNGSSEGGGDNGGSEGGDNGGSEGGGDIGGSGTGSGSGETEKPTVADADKDTVAELQGVADLVTPEDAEYYGITMLDLLVTYLPEKYDAIAGIHPVTENCAFYWDPVTNKILVVSEGEVIYPENASVEDLTACYALAETWRAFYTNEAERVFKLGGNDELTANGTVGVYTAAYHSGSVDLQTYTLTFVKGQFAIKNEEVGETDTVDLTIKNGTIKIDATGIGGKRISFDIQERCSLLLENIRFNVAKGCQLVIDANTVITDTANGISSTKIGALTPEQVQKLCDNNYTVVFSTDEKCVYIGNDFADLNT